LPSLIEGDRNGINGDKFRYNANDPKLLERVEDVNTPLILSELTVLKEVAGVEKMSPQTYTWANDHWRT
jgi:hypothetical protein